MLRCKLFWCAALVLLGVSSPGRSDDNAAGPMGVAIDSRVGAQIARLSSPDMDIREDAVARLINLRAAAWPALRRELQTAPPRLRNEIDRILLHIAWIKPGDNDGVQQAFTKYSEKDAEERLSTVWEFWMSPRSGQEIAAPASALLRIVLNDPCGAVRWRAADAMHYLMDRTGTDTETQENDELGKQIVGLVAGTQPDPQGYMPADRNAALIAAAGWAVHKTDPAVCTTRLESALKLEEEHPSAFRGQMDFVFDFLSERATTLRKHERLIQLLRERADRAPWEAPDFDGLGDMEEFFGQPAFLAAFNLFAAQASFGPDKEFKTDLLVYRDYFTHPEMVYTLSRLAEHNGNSALAQVIGDTAMLMNGLDGFAHYRAGLFLESRDWNLAAEREIKCCLFLRGIPEVDVYLKLFSLADRRTDDLAAAKYLQTALEKVVDSSSLTHVVDGKQVPWSPDEAWAEVYNHYLRVAQQANNLPGIKANLEKILGNDDGEKVLTADPNLAADVVPALQALGRNELADKIFDSAFTALDKKVTENPAEPMHKNNLAWMCACSGKRLDEAAKLIEQALVLAPGEGAYMDTQAEIFMRQGQPAKAVENEIKAIEDRPDDLYMPKQLARFRAAAAAKKTK